jgi:hypothetical protein
MCARGMVFNHCQNFTISGGTSTVQVNASNLDETGEIPLGLSFPSKLLLTGLDFRRVRPGDLCLVKEVAKQNIVEYHEVRHRRSGVIKRHIPRVVGLREIYRVHIHGSQEEFTAVVYQGSDFEKVNHILVLVCPPNRIRTAPGSCGMA